MTDPDLDPDVAASIATIEHFLGVAKAETKTDDGYEYPAAAYAYIGDPDVVSTWKLRLWETPDLKETRRQIGMAVAALGSGGFRGNRVRIPADQVGKVKRRVLQAWLKVHPDKERGDAPRVLLSSRPVVRTPDDDKEAEMDDQVENGQATDEVYMDHDYGVTAGGDDAMTHLLMAYRQMLDNPACFPLLEPLMALIHAKEAIMVAEPELVMVDDDEYGNRMGKDIVYRDGQYCVMSQETGRSFGCYADRAAAEARLGQIESFADDKVAGIETLRLVAYHDRLHQLPNVNGEHVAVHNLIEDELEHRGIAPPYNLGDIEAKLQMIAQDAGRLLFKVEPGRLPYAKQAEQRYTLGPVYVPGLEDAHGEYTDADTLQTALWNWVRKDDRRIYLQHSEKVAGEMVEVLTWPFEIEAPLEVPEQGVSKFTFPANTPFLGVVWEDWAWELVKAGELRGYSIGGRARRIEADLPAAALV